MSEKERHEAPISSCRHSSGCMHVVTVIESAEMSITNNDLSQDGVAVAFKKIRYRARKNQRIINDGCAHSSYVIDLAFS